MITASGFLPNVFEITDSEIKLPDKQEFPPQSPGKRPISKYVAPSTSILAIVNNKEVELVVGREITELTLQNVMGFGIKHRKPLKISKCEVLSNLRIVDRMVVLCNDILKSQEPSIEDILYSDSEDDANG